MVTNRICELPAVGTTDALTARFAALAIDTEPVISRNMVAAARATSADIALAAVATRVASLDFRNRLATTLTVGALAALVTCIAQMADVVLIGTCQMLAAIAVVIAIQTSPDRLGSAPPIPNRSSDQDAKPFATIATART